MLLSMVLLTDPLHVKSLVLRNRLVLPPMLTNLAAYDGSVTDALVEHYLKRAAYVGLVIVEASYVSEAGKYVEKQLGVHCDDMIHGLKRLVEGVHEMGACVVLQIVHAGSKSTLQNTIPLAPSSDGRSKELSKKEIGIIVDEFAKAAERAILAGFDGVEVHGAHGFLVNQFFSPLTNRRLDDYGGALENRMRFPLEVVEAIKDVVGNKLLLYRIGADDLTPGGSTVEDAKVLAKKLEEKGVDIIDVSGGVCGSRPAQFEGVEGYFIPYAHEIKKAVSVPVIGVGGIRSYEYANRILMEGYVDLVAVGRQLLKDPMWAKRALDSANLFKKV
ncbi:MAG: NADH:flavin oxidoreductase [Nitrososphaeria archaeon]|nr:NADH:flavin oxidoreductase [Nitrososphaeria archaeon]